MSLSPESERDRKFERLKIPKISTSSGIAHILNRHHGGTEQMATSYFEYTLYRESNVTIITVCSSLLEKQTNKQKTFGRPVIRLHGVKLQDH